MKNEKIEQEFAKLIMSGKSVNASQKILKQKYGHGLRNTVAYHLKAEITGTEISKEKQKIGRKGGLKSGYNRKLRKEIKIIIDDSKQKKIDFKVSERGKLWYIYYTAVCLEHRNQHEESFSFAIYHHTLKKMTYEKVKTEMWKVAKSEGWQCASGKTVFVVERYTT